MSKTTVDDVLPKATNHEYLKDINYITELENAKQEWSVAYRKHSFTLRAKTSQRVERMHRTIKTLVSPHTSLNEMLVRMTQLQLKLTNHDFEENELEKSD